MGYHIPRDTDSALTELLEQSTAVIGNSRIGFGHL